MTGVPLGKRVAEQICPHFMQRMRPVPPSGCF